jgi:hypothetical protein
VFIFYTSRYLAKLHMQWPSLPWRGCLERLSKRFPFEVPFRIPWPRSVDQQWTRYRQLKISKTIIINTSCGSRSLPLDGVESVRIGPLQHWWRYHSSASSEVQSWHLTCETSTFKCETSTWVNSSEHFKEQSLTAHLKWRVRSTTLYFLECGVVRHSSNFAALERTWRSDVTVGESAWVVQQTSARIRQD